MIAQGLLGVAVLASLFGFAAFKAYEVSPAAERARAQAAVQAERRLLVAVDMATGQARSLMSLESEATCLQRAAFNQHEGSAWRDLFDVRAGERFDCRAPK